MRLLPCPSPGCRSKGALLPPSPAYPNGEPYLSGQYVSAYACHRCGNNVTLSPADYHGAKELSVVDFERLARDHGNTDLKELPTRDLVAAGIPEKLKTTKGGTVNPAADLFDAGIRTAHDVDGLERENE